MARKKKHEEHENHERWLVSYADFITLLFAFFVVMYSISSVNEGKYRVLSESMAAAFRSSARSLEPIQVGNVARSPRPSVDVPVEIPMKSSFTPIIVDPDQYFVRNNTDMSINEDDWSMDEAAEQISYMADNLETALEPLIDEDLVSVTRDRLWLELEINSSILFTSANATPSNEAAVVLSQVASTFADYPNSIHVEGYTDDMPINTPVYPSNWELSSARAAAVVRLFTQYGIEPTRLASVGYGEHHPIADNTTPEGRAQNRRVVIVILANLQNKEDQSDYGDLELLRQKVASTY